MIKAHINQYPVRMMCRVLAVSPSSYYEWVARSPSLRSQDNARLTDKIKAVFDHEKSRAGPIRITKRLKAEGIYVGRNRVASIMRLNAWRARAAKNIKRQLIVIISCLLHLIYCNKILRQVNPMKNLLVTLLRFGQVKAGFI